jgi:hypothetical protein
MKVQWVVGTAFGSDDELCALTIFFFSARAVVLILLQFSENYSNRNDPTSKMDWSVVLDIFQDTPLNLLFLSTKWIKY